MQNVVELSAKQRLFWFFPVLFCFCMPFGSLLLSGLVVLWAVVSFLNFDLAQFKNGLRNRELQFLFLFFFLSCISAAFSSNKEAALFNIENKLSFIIIPYYLFCFVWPPQIIKKCIVAFVSGCFFACAYLIIRAFILYLQGQPQYFFYNQFSDFVHAASFTMYLVTAICLVVLHYPRWFAAQKQYLYISCFFTAVFVITIFLNSSKIGIISFFLVIPALIIYKLRKKLNVKIILIVAVGIVAAILISMKLFPTTYERLSAVVDFDSKNVDKTATESTAVRYLIWEQAVGIIKDNFIFGVTVGDANDALVKAYEANGITGALEHKYNAHNQYFQTFIGMGVIGFLLLCMITIGALVKGIIKKNFQLVVFALVIILNFLVESMLQRSDGTLFYVFFYCLFNRPNLDEELQ